MLNAVRPERKDHVYLYAIAKTVNRAKPLCYIGQAVYPGRALQHINSKPVLFNENWTLTYSQLPTPSLEDLTVFESALIDIVFDDFRIDRSGDLKNQNRGSHSEFRPRSWRADENLEVSNGIYMIWDCSQPNKFEFLEAIGNCPGLTTKTIFVTPPVANDENRDTIIRSLNQFAQSLRTGAPRLEHGYFQYLGEIFGSTDRLVHSQQSTEISIAQLNSIMNCDDAFIPFIYVQVNSDSFDDGRSGIGVGMTLSSLKERAEKYWEASSSSWTPRQTIRQLSLGNCADDVEYPKYLLLCHSESKLILMGWHILPAKWTKNENGKLTIPLGEMLDSSTLKQIIGKRLICTGNANWLQGKGVKWFNKWPDI